MYLTSIDKIAIRDYLKNIETILDGYNESSYDQIDVLRGSIEEAKEIVEGTHFDVGDEDEDSNEEASNQLEHDFHMANR